MQRDAQRYVPYLKNIIYNKSLYEIKTVLPASEVDDSRPILFKKNCYNIKNYHIVLGGKIDNVYEVIAEINKM